MCTVPPDSLQAVDLAYLKALEKLNYYTREVCISNACEASELTVCPHKNSTFCVEAARVCRARAWEVNALNATRHNVPMAHAKSVIDSLLRSTLIIVTYGQFDQRLADEALIASNYKCDASMQLLDLVNRHNRSQNFQPIIDKTLFFGSRLPSPAPNSMTVAHTIDEFRNALQKNFPCVLQQGIKIDGGLLLDQIINSSPYRWVPTEHGSSDFRSEKWKYSIKLLQDAIVDGNYVAQFPLHSHLGLDLDHISLFLNELNVGRTVSNCWFGPPNTRSPHHLDPSPNVYIAIHGTKFFQVIRPNADINAFLKPLSGVGERAACSIH